jgi:hypothetical protein
MRLEGLGQLKKSTSVLMSGIVVCIPGGTEVVTWPRFELDTFRYGRQYGLTFSLIVKVVLQAKTENIAKEVVYE